LVSALRTNLRLGRRDVALFELGRVFLPAADRPREERRLGVLLAGQWYPRHWSLPPRPFDLFDVKGIMELVFERLGDAPPVVDRTAPLPEFLHPGRAARLVRDGRSVGLVGVLHPEFAERLEIKGEAVLMELDLEALLEATVAVARFRSLDRYPAVERDLSILCDETAPAAEIDARVRQAAGGRLRSVSLVDRYTGNQVPPGKVSLTVSLRFQDQGRTLTSEEVQASVDAVVRELRAAGHEIRGE
jgi:phenylalanyl-tRNA synthetase beta chain